MGKASCDRVALPNLWRNLDVFVKDPHLEDYDDVLMFANFKMGCGGRCKTCVEYFCTNCHEAEVTAWRYLLGDENFLHIFATRVQTFPSISVFICSGLLN